MTPSAAHPHARATRRDWAEGFLDALAREGTIRRAARAVGVGRTTVYDRRRRDPDFAARMELVLGVVVMQAEDALTDIALHAESQADRIRAAEILLRARLPEYR